MDLLFGYLHIYNIYIFIYLLMYMYRPILMSGLINGSYTYVRLD